MPPRELILEGARQNNLRNISLALPHNSVIAVTGVSGSGKSSLAFDTIFAEGQWRFIESLSTYARLYLEKLDRPDVDALHHIRPAIALEQKNPVRGARSTVGTLTELYDLFRVLFSRISEPFCPQCGVHIRQWDPAQVVMHLLEHHLLARAVITFETRGPAAGLAARGYQRVFSDGDFTDIERLDPDDDGPFDVVVDRLEVADEPRLADSVELAWREGKGKIKVALIDTGKDLRDTGDQEPSCRQLRFSSQHVCDACGRRMPEPTPLLFSFNHPLCACPECKGFGNILVYDEDLIIPDKDLSLNGGAIEPWNSPGYRWWKTQLLKGLKKAGIDTETPYRDLPSSHREAIQEGAAGFYGIKDFFRELEGKKYKLHVRVFLSKYRSPVTCPACNGARLCEDALHFRIEGRSIADISGMAISDLLQWFRGIHLSPMQRDLSREALQQITLKLEFLERVGLDYLSPARQARTLSGGEFQRVNLSNQLASALTGTLYVLDEPTIGLHPRDTRRIAAIMRELSSRGNTVIVVEHDREIIATSDWVVELGPGGGASGGEIVFSGSIAEFEKAETPTALFVRGLSGYPDHGVGTGGLSGSHPVLALRGASGNNLRHTNLTVPLSRLVAVTGVSGSGKSSLIIETLYRAVARHLKTDTAVPLPYRELKGLSLIRGLRLVDQSPIGKTPRSNPLTYLKMFEPIRKLFARQPEARAHGYPPGHFSFNIAGGRCETCKGEGYQKMEMYFFEDIFVKCEECKGRRYREETLRVTYRGKNISEVLDMTIEEAASFFGDIEDLVPRFTLLRDMGLSYLRLGQAAPTLSGGEAQRLKICAELASQRKGSRGILYILDEPTVGLHHNDVVLLLRILRLLVSTGNTVVVIEHNLDVVDAADWVIDLGPEGGDKGGAILFEGTPDDLVTAADSFTGAYLKEYRSAFRQDPVEFWRSRA